MSSKTRSSGSADVLLSWDRLGFRLLVFGGLALLWILPGRVLKLSWGDLILAELVSLMPWAFLAPIVLFFGTRFRLDRLGPGRFLAVHVLGIVLVFIPFWLIQRTIMLVWAGFAKGWEVARLANLAPTRQNVLGSLLEIPLIYLLILLAGEAMKHARARREEELEAGRLAGQLAEARLALLQRQLHPHFLFNALQAISTLLYRDPATADGLLVRLSSLLRAMLEKASEPTLSLRMELELTRRYLDIEQVRFADRLSVEWDVDESLLDSQVPSLIVLPLVENSIRHGLSPKVGPGRLRISARSQGASLVLAVEDDGLGATLPLRAGVGIANTRERLDAMYGEKAGLEITTTPGGGLCATVRLPLPEARP
jgi:two-component system, LytTR family, sensor kinase